MRFGTQELLIVLILVLIIFGAGKLPQVLRSMGQGVKAFKDEVNSSDDPPETPTTPTVER